MSNLKNSENLQFGDFRKLSIWKVTKIFNSENSKKFLNFTISKIIKFLKLLFRKTANFQNFTIWKTIKIP